MPDAPRKLLKLSSVAALAGCLALAGCGSTSGGAPSEASSNPGASPTKTFSATASPTATSSEPREPEASSTPADEESEQTETIGGQELGKLPSNATEYADALVVAWGNGNEAQMKQLATAQVVASLTGHSAAGGPNWSQTSNDAGAGSVFVSYENAEDGTVLNLRVQNQVVGQGHEQGVVEASFE